jgi:hypothetical protein
MSAQPVPAEDTPIVCTISPGAEAEQAMTLYRSLFADALLSRERTTSGVRWRFRDGEGIEARVRALADLEERCCAFLRMRVAVAEGAVTWDLVGPRTAQAFLDEYYRLPETMNAGIEDLRDRVSAAGLTFDER